MAKTQPQDIGFWTMVRDVLIASLNRGQFALGLFGLTLLTMVARMPPADLSKLAFEVLQRLESGALLGYVLAVAATVGWFAHARWQRRLMGNEVDRIASQRTALQKNALGKKVKSSRQ